MTEELETRAAELALLATCTKCGTRVVPSIAVTTGMYRQVGGLGQRHFNLCSVCGPLFRLFLGETVIL